MSKGPGRIERGVRALFDAHPDLAFATIDLVEHCFPGVTQETAERKHFVSVLRAAFKVIADDPDWDAWRINGQGRGWVFVNQASEPSCAQAEYIVGEFRAFYRSPKRALRHIGGPYRRWVPDKAVPALQETGVTIEHYKSARMIRGYRREAGAYAVTFPPFEHLVTERPKLLEATSKQADSKRIKLAAAFHIAGRDGDLARVATLEAEAKELRAETEAEGKLLAARLRRGVGLATEEDKHLLLSASFPDGESGNDALIDAAILLHRLLHDLPARVRGAAAQNDPDAQRDELTAIAAELDQLRDLFDRAEFTDDSTTPAAG